MWVLTYMDFLKNSISIVGIFSKKELAQKQLERLEGELIDTLHCGAFRVVYAGKITVDGTEKLGEVIDQIRNETNWKPNWNPWS